MLNGDKTIRTFDIDLQHDPKDNTYRYAIDAPGGSVWITLSETLLEVNAATDDTTKATLWVEHPFPGAYEPQDRSRASPQPCSLVPGRAASRGLFARSQRCSP